MTIEELLFRARELIISNTTPQNVLVVANGITDVLGGSTSWCGYEQPSVGWYGTDAGYRVRFEGIAPADYGTEELRAVCLMLLRACDKADALNAHDNQGDRDG